MPVIAYIVSGTISAYNGTASSNAIVKFTIGQETGYSVTNSSGQYLYDLANLNYTVGDIVTYSIEDQFRNEKSTGSFTITGSSYTLNSTLSPITNANALPSNRATQIYTIGGEPVSALNPFPVTTDITIGDIKLGEVGILNAAGVRINPATGTITKCDTDDVTITSIPHDTLTNTDVVSVEQSNATKLNATIAGSLIQKNWDYVGVTYPTTSSEVYTFKTGGAGGTQVYTVTLVYSDASKANLTSVTRA